MTKLERRMTKKSRFPNSSSFYIRHSVAIRDSSLGIGPAAGDFDQRSHECPARAAVGPGFWFFDERRAGDVDVGPGALVDELFEELGGRDCSAPATLAHIFDVGHFALDLLVVLREHWQLPN